MDNKTQGCTFKVYNIKKYKKNVDETIDNLYSCKYLTYIRHFTLSFFGSKIIEQFISTHLKKFLLVYGTYGSRKSAKMKCDICTSFAHLYHIILSYIIWSYVPHLSILRCSPQNSLAECLTHFKHGCAMGVFLCVYKYVLNKQHHE